MLTKAERCGIIYHGYTEPEELLMLFRPAAYYESRDIMNLKEFYDFIGEDYNEVIGRFRAESRVYKYVMKFPDDKSFDSLISSMKEKNYAEAFRAAHTIKGTSLNFSFNSFAAVASDITEKLRHFEDTSAIESDPDLDGLIKDASEKYEKIISGIKQIDPIEQ